MSGDWSDSEIPQYSAMTPFDPMAYRGAGYERTMSNRRMSNNVQQASKPSRAPYEVRTPRFSSFPTMEPFDPKAYRSTAAYKKMLAAKKGYPDVPLQARIPEPSNSRLASHFSAMPIAALRPTSQWLRPRKVGDDPSRYGEFGKLGLAVHLSSHVDIKGRSLSEFHLSSDNVKVLLAGVVVTDFLALRYPVLKRKSGGNLRTPRLGKGDFVLGSKQGNVTDTASKSGEGHHIFANDPSSF